MAQTVSPRTLDALRVYGLSRIPRCRQCPRLRALRMAQQASTAALPRLPEVPDSCRHEACAPLASRYYPPASLELLAG